MIRLEQAVIVEGKYDKITLENVIDAYILPTDGFRIFKDLEMRALIRTLAQKRGIVVITDSDAAGSMIRSHIKSIAAGCEVTNVYLPSLKGKEKRKARPGREGLLGLEGMDAETILDALRKSGITGKNQAAHRAVLTKADFYALGLSGQAGSAAKRRALLRHLGLPASLSSNAMLDACNTLYTPEEFKREAAVWEREAVKE